MIQNARDQEVNPQDTIADSRVSAFDSHAGVHAEVVTNEQVQDANRSDDVSYCSIGLRTGDADSVIANVQVEEVVCSNNVAYSHVSDTLY